VTATLQIRAARTHEADALTWLAVRSKAHWGYDDAFLDASLPDLTVSSKLAASGSVLVADADGDVGGFASLVGELPELALAHCLVDPAFLRCGIGRRLVEAVIKEARRRRASSLRVESDPNAEGFFRALGFERVGDAPSIADTSRRLPLLRLAL